jgi:hypothetical protein
VIASYEHSSLFGLVVSNKGKKFYDIDTWTSDDVRTYWIVVCGFVNAENSDPADDVTSLAWCEALWYRSSSLKADKIWAA